VEHWRIRCSQRAQTKFWTEPSAPTCYANGYVIRNKGNGTNATILPVQKAAATYFQAPGSTHSNRRRLHSEAKAHRDKGAKDLRTNSSTTECCNHTKQHGKKHAVQHNVSDCDNCSSLRSWTDSLSKLAAFSSRMPETDSHRLFKSD